MLVFFKAIIYLFNVQLTLINQLILGYLGKVKYFLYLVKRVLGDWIFCAFRV